MATCPTMGFSTGCHRSHPWQEQWSRFASSVGFSRSGHEDSLSSAWRSVRVLRTSWTILINFARLLRRMPRDRPSFHWDINAQLHKSYSVHCKNMISYVEWRWSHAAQLKTSGVNAVGEGPA